MKPFQLIQILIAVIALSSCSQEKNTIVNRGYHNLTARYNGFFNGRLALQEAHTSMKESYEEDYTNLLPIYIALEEGVAQPAYPKLDRAIQKTSLVVDRHSMDIKGKEYCKWIDDTWLVMGEAQFLKGELTQAKQIFDFTKRKYEDPEIKQLSYYWLARVYTEQEQYSRASDQLRKVSLEDGFPEKMLGELYAFRAYFYLEQDRIEDAVEELERSVKYTKKRDVKTRRMFILAQLYRLDGDGIKSSQTYANIIKRNPEYEMTFYAKINRALAYDVTAGNTQEIKDILFDMLKDDKNIEFQDQIYYALAELELKENNEVQGIEYLKLATKKSVKNGNAKGLAFLKLGDIYFNKLNYPIAQAYYDSTVTFLSTEHPDYENILARANSLTQMMRDVEIINHQDSLQAFVQLSEKEQEEKIDQIIQDLEEREAEEKRQKEIAELRAMQASAQQNNQINRNIGRGEWYFYNPAAINFGVGEFKKIWGARKNEDHWRRADKTSLAPLLVAEEGEDIEADTLDGANDPKNPNYYKKELPDTDEKLVRSNALIIEALYDLAGVYKDQMMDQPKAIETFEELITRFDSSKYHPNVYYQLYLMMNETGNQGKADYYKNKLLAEYPESDYAKAILNPNYAQQEEQKDEAVKEFYEKAYAYFEQGFYRESYKYAYNGEEQFPNSSYQPKFDFLQALCLGYIDGEERMIQELNNVKNTYANDDVGKEAADILAYFNEEEQEKQKQQEQKEAEAELLESLEETKAKYKYNIGSMHNFILIVPDSVDIEMVKNTTSNFNRKYFSTKGFKTTSIPLKAEKTMVVVSEVGIAPKSMDYFNTYTKAAPETKDLLSQGVIPFTISFENYAFFYKSQMVEAYLAFFNEEYLKEK